MGTTGVEGAAGGRGRWIGEIADEQASLLSFVLCDTGQRSEECFAVGVTGSVKHYLGGAAFHNATQVHNRNGAAQVTHHREVMGNKEE